MRDLGRAPAGGRIGRFGPYAVVSPDGRAVAYVWYRLEERFETVRGVMQVLDVERGHVGPVIATRHVRTTPVAWHPDGQHLVSGGGEGTLQLWDARAGTLVRSRDVRWGLGRVQSVSFLDDGRQLVAGRYGGVLPRPRR